jgi:hypothetical protein
MGISGEPEANSCVTKQEVMLQGVPKPVKTLPVISVSCYIVAIY